MGEKTKEVYKGKQKCLRSLGFWKERETQLNSKSMGRGTFYRKTKREQINLHQLLFYRKGIIEKVFRQRHARDALTLMEK